MAKDFDVQEGGAPAARDYNDPPPAPFLGMEELRKWSLYRAVIAEFVATLLFLYISVLTVIGYKAQTDEKAGGVDCGGVGILGIAWAFGGMIFVLVYCTAGISGKYVSTQTFESRYTDFHVRNNIVRNIDSINLNQNN